MQVPPRTGAGGAKAKQHLETKQEDCAREGQTGGAGARGTSANKASAKRACRAHHKQRSHRGGASMQGGKGTITGPGV